MNFFASVQRFALRISPDSGSLHILAGDLVYQKSGVLFKYCLCSHIEAAVDGDVFARDKARFGVFCYCVLSSRTGPTRPAGAGLDAIAFGSSFSERT